MAQLFHSWAYSQRTPHPTTEIFVPSYLLLLFYSIKQGDGTHLVVHQQKNGYWKHGKYIK